MAESYLDSILLIPSVTTEPLHHTYIAQIIEKQQTPKPENR